MCGKFALMHDKRVLCGERMTVNFGLVFSRKRYDPVLFPITADNFRLANFRGLTATENDEN